MKKFFKNLFWSRWKVIRTIWPYPDGYGVYRKHLITGKFILLDSGIATRIAAQYIADQQNKQK